ncbi:MAG: dynamin family protein [Lachnospiraceae bacterium]|nr:dynamin family protein [Lachnospiraceae bacterium]
MGAYQRQQEMMDRVCEDITVCTELIGEKDASRESVYGFVPGLGSMANQEAALKEQVHKLREGIFQVLFTGGFSAGTSTLLNALMRKDVLKMSIKAETAVITKIIFNAPEKVIVYKKQVDANGNRLKEEYSVGEFFEKFRVSQEHAEKFEDIDYVQLQQAQDGIGGSLVQLVDSPGTSNSEVDTEMARSFAEKASAIVYLISGLQPFTDEDKQYIKSHYAGRGIKNVFFVINRFDNVQPEEVETLKANVRQQLTGVFTVNGQFDEQLFRNRVFYTNAYGSLNTRVGRPTKTPYGDFMIDDSQTGVPEFEHALSEFLTDDNRDRDALAAYIPKLATIYAVARNKVNEELTLYREGAEKIRRDSQQLDASMEKIKRVLEAIEALCKNKAGELVREIKQAYDNYVAAVESGWDSHFDDPEVMKNIHFNSLDMIRLATTKNEALKKEKMKPIQNAVENYIDSKSAVLQGSISDIIKAKMIDLENSLKNFQDQLESLDCPIDINEIMKSIGSAVAVEGTSSPDLKINSFQLFLGILGADPEIAIDAFNGSKSNKQAIISSVGKNLFEYVALYVVAWPIGLAMLAKRGFDMIKGWKEGGNQSVKELLKGLKPEMIQSLREGKAKVAMDMEKKAGGAIIRAGKTFSESFLTELESYRQSFDEMLANLNDKTFNIEYEEARTSKLLAEMVGRISDISRLTRGEVLDEQGVLSFAESNASGS